MAKLVVMYRKPKDTGRFKKIYREVHIPLVRNMPGVRDLSYGYPIGPDGEEAACFCFFEATFDSVDAIEKAFASPAGQDVLGDIPNYSPDHQPVRLFMDLES